MKARINITVEDADGETRPVHVWCLIDDATTLSDAINSYMKFLYDNISVFVQGAMPQASLTLFPDISGFEQFNSGALSDVQEGVVLTFRTTNRTETKLTIPTFTESYLTNSGAGKILDITDADVLLFLALMTEDDTNGGINAIDFHGSDVVQYLSSEQKFG